MEEGKVSVCVCMCIWYYMLHMCDMSVVCGVCGMYVYIVYMWRVCSIYVARVYMCCVCV